MNRREETEPEVFGRANLVYSADMGIGKIGFLFSFQGRESKGIPK